MTDSLNLGQLTQAMIVSRLQEVHDAPAIAAEIARKTLVSGVRATQAAGQSPQDAVREVCKGTMAGLLLIEKDLPAGAVRVLQCIAETAQELHLDPSEMMTWAMEGIAAITPVLSHERRYAIRAAIEEAFLGAGEIFDGLCSRAGKA